MKTKQDALLETARRCKVGKKCHHVVISPSNRPCSRGIMEVDCREVTLMAVSGKWAMVRRPRCAPYVTQLVQLEPIPK